MAFTLPSFNAPLPSSPTLGVNTKLPVATISSPSPSDPTTTYGEYIQKYRSIGNSSSLQDLNVQGQGNSVKGSGNVDANLQKVAVSDQFMRWAAIDATDFAKSFGYEFVIYDSSNGSVPLERLPMPISPSAISMSVPAATNITVTMKGIVEESNGAPLRHIRINGSTGMLPALSEGPGGTQFTGNSLSSLAQYAFKNTIRAAGNAVNQVQQTLAAFSGGNQATAFINYSNTDISSKQLVTGYDFFHALARFFDYYLALKKQTRGARLAFQMYKDQMYYDVILNGYDFTKGAGTLEYQYNVSLTAYRRRAQPITSTATSGRVGSSQLLPTQAQSLNALASIMNGLRQSQVALASVMPILQGVTSDIQGSFLTPVSEALIFGTNLLQTARQVADYVSVIGPEVLATAYQQMISQQAGNLTSAFHGMSQQGVKTGANTANNNNQSLTTQSQIWGQNTLANISGTSDVGNSPLGSFISSSNQQHNIANLGVITSILQNLSPEDLPLSASAQKSIQNADNQIAQLSAQDFMQRRNSVESFLVQVEEAFGGGDPNYNRVNGLPPPPVQKQLDSPTIEMLSQINDILIAYDQLIFFLQEESPNLTNDYLTYYQSAAVNSGIAFQDSVSIFRVPFPYGATLQSLALTYLGNSDRWIEIAAANGLQSPYIDETGFEYDLLAPGASNTVTIATNQNLYVGQVVFVGSNTQPEIALTISTIDVISAAQVLITLNGVTDLSSYKPEDKAFLFSYLPNTVNSSLLIGIPSDAPVSIPTKIKITPGVDDLSGINQISKVDFLLNQTGDLIINSGGDIALAAGLTNIVQAAVLKVQTEPGTLVDNPSWGAGIKVGSSVADIKLSDYLNSINQAFADDGRFQGVQMAQISLQGPLLSVQILTRVSNTDTYLPIGTTVPV